jgi:threonylcarbamoyladenosine tRNA methylthiotransferase MtaB
MPTFHVENFGCRATQADGAAIERQFEVRGLSQAPAAQADLVLLNTCTVTAAADQDARAAIRRVQRTNPEAKIVVTGCYAQRAPEEIAALPGVTAVVGNSHKHQIADILLRDVFPDKFEIARHAQSFLPVSALAGHSPLATGVMYVSDIFAHTELLAAPVFESAGSTESSRTRPNLKVQDGCDNRCSFCVIPNVRGQSRSLQASRILAEVNALVAAGYREIVISGINLGRWGRDLVDRLPASAFRHAEDASFAAPNAGRRTPNFAALLRGILKETAIEKIRISSVEPMDWTDELIALVAESPRIAKHAHVPLQSASDAVLRRMHRKYRPWHYREKIEKIRAAMPMAAIGADVMVGFPGESGAEFEETRRFIEELPFTYLHVFTFSARPGTPAATMRDQIPVHVARERNKILRDLAVEKKLSFMRSFVGQAMDVITLSSSVDTSICDETTATQIPNDTFRTEALTDNFQKLFLKGRHAPNQWRKAQIENVIDSAFIASVAL